MNVLTEAKQQTQYVYVKQSWFQRLLRKTPKIVGYNQRFIEINTASASGYSLRDVKVLSEMIHWTTPTFPLWNGKAVVPTELHYGRWV